MNAPRGIARAVIDDRWRTPNSRGKDTIEAEITTSATYCRDGGPRIGITCREAEKDTIDARRLHFHMDPDKARALAKSLIEMARSAEEMEQAERIRTAGGVPPLPDWIRLVKGADQEPAALGADEYGNPSTMIEVSIGGKTSPARAVHIRQGGRYGLNGCKIADEPMIEIQPWPAAGTWRGAGFRWSVDVLNGRSRWASGNATARGLCIHGGSIGGHDPEIRTTAAQITRAFLAFDLDTNPNNHKEA